MWNVCSDEWKKTMLEKKEVLLKINDMKNFRKPANRWTVLCTLHCVYMSIVFSRKTVN